MQGELLGAAAPGGVQRLFFALLPDAPLRARIAAVAADLAHAHAAGGRLLVPERYHLTLNFLGDFLPLPPALVDSVCAAADDVRMAAFDLTLDRAGSFAGSRVWWLGTSQALPAQALWRSLGDALVRRGVRAQPGAFTPHLTIVRDARHALAPCAIDPLQWRVDGFALVRSRPGRPYDILQRWEAG